MFPSRRRVHLTQWILFLSVFLVDRLLKEVLRFLHQPNLPEASLPLVSGVLYLYRSEDLQGAMSFLRDFPEFAQRTLPAVFAGAFSVFLFVWIRRLLESDSSKANPLILILSGIASNGIDLLCFGHAMKTLTWRVGVSWSFNLADLAVFTGLSWLILQRLKMGRVHSDRQRP